MCSVNYLVGFSGSNCATHIERYVEDEIEGALRPVVRDIEAGDALFQFEDILVVRDGRLVQQTRKSFPRRT